MSIFNLDREIVENYARFARSFTKISAKDLLEQIDLSYRSGRFWPDPMIQINPKFKIDASVSDLVRAGDLHPGTEEIYGKNGTFNLYRHQTDAIGLANRGESFVVTTGTGSGKSTCYFLPIINHVLRTKSLHSDRRTRAIVIYPMNALANSQMKEFDNRLANTGYESRVIARRYTGQDSEAERRQIQANPPDILLTNFMMLELLLTRQDELDRDILKHCEGLEFLVLDELHTYRGRQGADVAMLVRRLRQRLQSPASSIQCIGTSATMASDGQSSASEVARVASAIFATPIAPSAVVTETLVRATSDEVALEDLDRENLLRAVETFDPSNSKDEDLRSNPFMVWIELTLGLEREGDGLHFRRAKPRDLTDAAASLAEATGLDSVTCQSRLEVALEAASRPESERGGSGSNRFFPVRLHRFISGAGGLLTTLEPPGRRTVALAQDAGLADRTDACFFPTYFCRQCGQEHHLVRMIDSDDGVNFADGSIDDPLADEEDADVGYLTPVSNEAVEDFGGDPEDYPEAWWEEKKGEIRLKKTYSPHALKLFKVMPDGKVAQNGFSVWYQSGKFRFCAACRHTHSTGRDANRLAGLSAEGRSSASTVLITSALRYMAAPPQDWDKTRRKVLAFTDNRQDAALQAGHFNDFVFITLLRGAVLAAFDRAGDSGLTDAVIGRRLIETLGFEAERQDRLACWLADPELVLTARQRAEQTLAQILAHRFWYDQRRGWRYTFPNLEQLGLIDVDYVGLSAFCRDERSFGADLLPLKNLNTEQREACFRLLLDGARQGLAVRTDALDRERLDALIRDRRQILSPWGFDDDDEAKPTPLLTVGRAPSGRNMPGADDLVRTGPQSRIGKALNDSLSPRLKGQSHTELVIAMANALRSLGLLVPVSSGDTTGYRLAADAVIFRRGKGDEGGNAFFRDQYETVANALSEQNAQMFGDEAREHTAQVDQERREWREKRFRYGTAEIDELTRKRDKLRDIGERADALPVLLCSPTMELGIDIADLDMVYLRNVPPSPANYAQRSGRAGRSGAAALVLTYCAAQSPHDQYFFARRADMIQGIVRPPTIDLANHELVKSHLDAIWLADMGEALSGCIAEVLDMSKPDQPLSNELEHAISREELVDKAATSMTPVLCQLKKDYGDLVPPWFDEPEQLGRRTAREAPAAFRRTFDRWRDMLKSAEGQRDAADRIVKDYTIRDPKERSKAERLSRLADQQIRELLTGSTSSASDFYTYRYLATEGFLPGYNFPRLPLMAYMEGSGDRGGRSYVQRPRFLAISEFGPHSLIYHEGQAYRVVRAQMPASEREQGSDLLLTGTAWRCQQCGARHDQEPERCHACDGAFGYLPVHAVRRIENLAARPATRITANDEERQRRGFEIVTTFAWSKNGQRLDVSRAAVLGSDATPLAIIDYAPAAKLHRLNLGLKRRKNQSEYGFLIDPKSGHWKGSGGKSENGTPDHPEKAVPQRIVPMVEDRKNALLLRPPGGFASLQAAAVVQHALLRGIETVFQLEQGEILVEPMPHSTDRRALLFYEASEGGAGILGQFVRDEKSLAAVAAQALQIMHFAGGQERWQPDNLTTVTDPPACSGACYRCLLSYTNQPDHGLLKRDNKDALRFLCALAEGRAVAVAGPQLPQSEEDDGPSIVERFLQSIRHRDLPEPRIKISGDGWQITWPSALIVLFLGPTGCDRQQFEDMDFRVLEVDLDPDRWPEVFELIQSLFEEAA